MDKTAFFQIPEGGLLRIEGEDRISFLQRQTTNDLSLLAPGAALLTVLITPAARILDALTVIEEEGALIVLTLPGYSESTARYLRSRIFFMDKVSVHNPDAELIQVDLFGGDAEVVLKSLGLSRVPQGNQAISAQWDGVGYRVLAKSAAVGLGYRLLVPSTQGKAFLEALEQAGVMRLQPEDYHVRRVEAGIPAPGSELSEAYTPLEVGLGSAVSHSKGCYTGQEVIARQTTYDKITQHLCGLKLERSVEAGERVWGEDKAIGLVTSCVVSPRFGTIALAVLKRPYDQTGTELVVGEEASKGTRAHVVSLPFQVE